MDRQRHEKRRQMTSSIETSTGRVRQWVWVKIRLMKVVYHWLRVQVLSHTLRDLLQTLHRQLRFHSTHKHVIQTTAPSIGKVVKNTIISYWLDQSSMSVGRGLSHVTEPAGGLLIQQLSRSRNKTSPNRYVRLMWCSTVVEVFSQPLEQTLLYYDDHTYRARGEASQPPVHPEDAPPGAAEAEQRRLLRVALKCPRGF